MTEEQQKRDVLEADAFNEVISVMDSEMMIRLRRRFEKRGKDVMAALMGDKIEERALEEKAEHEREEAERKKHKKEKLKAKLKAKLRRKKQ